VSSQRVVQYDELAVLLSLENVPLSLETVLDTGTDTYHTLLHNLVLVGLRNTLLPAGICFCW